MPGLDRWAVGQLLAEIGARLELTGEPAFKTQAYRRAAELVRSLPDAETLMQQPLRLRELPGIGEALAEKILTLHQRGTHPTLERLRREVPDGLLELSRVAGLGPKRVTQLRGAAGIENLDALEDALRSGRLAAIKGFGPKVRAGIAASIAFIRATRGLRLLPDAESRLAAAGEAARKHAFVAQAVAAGETRRGCEVVASLALAVAVAPPHVLPPLRPEWPDVAVFAGPPANFGATLVRATGSDRHLAALERRAAGCGLRFTERGLQRGETPLATPDEAAFYAALELPCLEPELREDGEEVERAAREGAPRLVRAEDVRGLFHAHTTSSDGANTLEEMAAAAQALGMEYFGLADHSQSSAYAGGLTEEGVRRQWGAVDQVNRRAEGEGLNFRVLKGIEADIREDGSLDYSDEILAGFDFVVASIHSRFELPEARQTERTLRAVRNPATTILGHPTGRLLLSRPGYGLDVEVVLRACAEANVAVEVNAYPNRLDLDWRWHRRARELGVKLCLNPDAHCVGELAYFRYGVVVARKGGAGSGDVLNCLGRAALLDWLRKRRQPRT